MSYIKKSLKNLVKKNLKICKILQKKFYFKKDRKMKKKSVYETGMTIGLTPKSDLLNDF